MRRLNSIWLICSLFALAVTGGQAAIVLTNSFPVNSGQFGTVLTNEHFDSFDPGPEDILLFLPNSSSAAIRVGHSEQWRFYVITNETGFTNAAFVVFDPPAISGWPGVAGVTDIDLYVSNDPLLLDLDPGAFSYAWRSTERGSDDLVQLHDALPGPYYIALKCESHAGGEVGLAAFFSEEPFSSVEPDGRVILKAVPLLGLIPEVGEEGSESVVFGIPPEGLMLRRVAARTHVSHPSPSDLRTTLTHRGETIVLRDFTASSGEEVMFDDSAENDLPGAVPAATSGGLSRWNGEFTSGAWIVRHASQGAAGTNVAAEIWLYPQTAAPAVILPGGERWEYFRAPESVTNITLNFSMTLGDGPLWIEVSPASRTNVGYNQLLLPAVGSDTLVIDALNDPPVQPGLWRIRLRNDGVEEAFVEHYRSYKEQPLRDDSECVRLSSAVGIEDDALTVISIPITNASVIRSMEVGLRANHSRMSDLAFTLISPAGTRVLLQSHRGGASTNGLGSNIVVTNVFPVTSSGGPLAASNTINLKRTSGELSILYEFYGIPDWMKIFYETNLIFDTGLAQGSRRTNILYGPGAATTITVVVNEGDNSDPDTAWFYSISASFPDYSFFTFSDDPAHPPVKFALPPFSSTAMDGGPRTVMPETPLFALAGEAAAGIWRLEVKDAYAGPDLFPAEVVDMELVFDFEDRTPALVRLPDGVPVEVSLAPLQTKWFEASTFVWTERVGSCIVTSDTPVSLLFSPVPPGPGAPPPATLLANVQGGCFELSGTSSPPVLPGTKYYLALRNDTGSFVQAVLQLNAEPVVRTLITHTPSYGNSLQAGESHYYTFNVLESAQRLQFRLSGLSGDGNLFVKEGLPLPQVSNAFASSQNPGTEEEWIVLREMDVPGTLAGTWFAAVVNTEEWPINYSIEAIQSVSSGIPIEVTPTPTEGNEIRLRWTSIPGAAYQVISCTDLEDGEWGASSERIIADDSETTHCIPMSQSHEFFRVVELTGQ